MKISWLFMLFCLVLTALYTALHFQSMNSFYLLFIGSIAVTCFLLKGQENIKHIVTVLLLFAVVEWSLFSYFMHLNEHGLPAYQTNVLVFGLHFITDIMVLILLKYRVRLSLRYVRHTNPTNWRSVYMTHADPILYGIFFTFVIVDLAAFGENLIRYMDLFFGVSEEASKPFWSWSWVYKSYEYLKSILLACVITTLLATIFVERQRPNSTENNLEKDTVEH